MVIQSSSVIKPLRRSDRVILQKSIPKKTKIGLKDSIFKKRITAGISDAPWGLDLAEETESDMETFLKKEIPDLKRLAKAIVCCR